MAIVLGSIADVNENGLLPALIPTAKSRSVAPSQSLRAGAGRRSIKRASPRMAACAERGLQLVHERRNRGPGFDCTYI